MKQIHIGVFLGSFRKESYSRKIANAISQFFPNDIYKITILPLDTLPLYNQDFEEFDQTPEAWISYREIVKELDAFLIVTPEYNRSVTPVLKNAIDIASRPPKNNLWSGMPGAIISISPGSLGGFGGHQQVLQALTCLDAYVMPTPETYFGGIAKKFTDDGVLKDDKTLRFLENVANSMRDWLERFLL